MWTEGTNCCFKCTSHVENWRLRKVWNKLLFIFIYLFSVPMCAEFLIVYISFMIRCFPAFYGLSRRVMWITAIDRNQKLEESLIFKYVCYAESTLKIQKLKKFSNWDFEKVFSLLRKVIPSSTILQYKISLAATN